MNISAYQLATYLAYGGVNIDYVNENGLWLALPEWCEKHLARVTARGSYNDDILVKRHYERLAFEQVKIDIRHMKLCQRIRQK